MALLNPINHTSSRADVQRYKVEPYVVAADVYSVAPHIGRGGWTWYTGSAGWLYRAGLEWLLGFRVRAGTLLVTPCIPADWPGFEISFKHASARYEILVSNPERVCRGVARMELDGVRLPTGQTHVLLADDGLTHVLRVTLGEGAEADISTAFLALPLPATPVAAIPATPIPTVKAGAGRIPS
jgi:cyclic beta-1,2-glucan synthetase